MESEQTEIIRMETRGPIVVAHVRSGSLKDVDSIGTFGEHLKAFLKSHPGANILLNFEHVDYLSSAALTELIAASELARKHGGRLRICGLTDEVRKVFQITRLDRLFHCEQPLSLDAALDAFQKAVVSRGGSTAESARAAARRTQH